MGIGGAGGGAASSLAYSGKIVDNFPVAISANIHQGDIGNGASSQTASSSATGGTASMGLSLAGLGL